MTSPHYAVNELVDIYRDDSMVVSVLFHKLRDLTLDKIISIYYNVFKERDLKTRG